MHIPTDVHTKPAKAEHVGHIEDSRAMVDVRVDAVAMLRELIDRYWSLAHAEGKEGRDHDTEDGAAQQCRGDIEEILRSLDGVALPRPTRLDDAALRQWLVDVSQNKANTPAQQTAAWLLLQTVAHAGVQEVVECLHGTPPQYACDICDRSTSGVELPDEPKDRFSQWGAFDGA
jgi:hypothetical protein